MISRNSLESWNRSRLRTGSVREGSERVSDLSLLYIYPFLYHSIFVDLVLSVVKIPMCSTVLYNIFSQKHEAELAGAVHITCAVIFPFLFSPLM